MTQDGGVRRAAPLALFAAALLVRAGGWREVLGGERVVPVGNDAFYHLRRIAYAVFRHPEFLDFDPYLHFPNGAQPIWPPLFDASVAAVLRPFVPPLSDGGLERLELLAMWVPPVLGAVAVVLTGWIGRRHFGEGAGLLAGAALCLLSGHFWYSQLGFLDHHAAVAALAALLLGAGLSLVESHGSGRAGATLGWGLLVGAVSALCLLTWPGSLLHVGLVHAGLLGFALTRVEAGSAARFAAVLAAGHALAGLIVAPSALANDWPQWGAFSPVVLSRFQPWLFAAAVLTSGGCALAWRTAPLGGGRTRRALVFAALLAAVAAGSALLLPALVEGAADAWRWLAREEAFQARVSESLPLLSDGGRFSLRVAVVRLSLFVLVMPLAAIWIVWRRRGRPDHACVAVLAWFALGLLAVTLIQKRFFNSASIGLVLVLAVCARELWRGAGPARRAAVAAGVALCLLPSLEPYTRYAANELRARRGEKLAVTGAFGASRAALETATWLRTQTPETSGWLRADRAPEYGVLAPWHLGHVIQYVARRPTVVDNFGDDLGEEAFAFADRFYLSPEAEVAGDAAERGVRYVVSQRPADFLSQRPGPGDLARALFDVAPLERHRLRFESRGLRWTDPEAEPVYRVYELVAGAQIVGRSAPGATVEVRAGVSTSRGRRFFYERRVAADGDGTWRVRVPYATAGGPEALQVAPLYRLRCGEEVRGVAVPEDAVREGAVVAGPTLCADTARGREGDHAADPL